MGREEGLITYYFIILCYLILVICYLFPPGVDIRG
jgi:hypothetical protein